MLQRQEKRVKNIGEIRNQMISGDAVLYACAFPQKNSSPRCVAEAAEETSF